MALREITELCAILDAARETADEIEKRVKEINKAVLEAVGNDERKLKTDSGEAWPDAKSLMAACRSFALLEAQSLLRASTDEGITKAFCDLDACMATPELQERLPEQAADLRRQRKAIATRLHSVASKLQEGPNAVSSLATAIASIQSWPYQVSSVGGPGMSTSQGSPQISTLSETCIPEKDGNKAVQQNSTTINGIPPENPIGGASWLPQNGANQIQTSNVPMSNPPAGEVQPNMTSYTQPPAQQPMAGGMPLSSPQFQVLNQAQQPVTAELLQRERLVIDQERQELQKDSMVVGQLAEQWRLYYNSLCQQAAGMPGGPAGPMMEQMKMAMHKMTLLSEPMAALQQRSVALQMRETRWVMLVNQQQS